MQQQPERVTESRTLSLVVDLLLAAVGRKGEGPAQPAYLSRTLWVMVGALAVLAVQAYSGEWVIAPEYQGMLVAALAVLLRLLTGTQVTLKGDAPLDIPNAPRKLRKRIARDLAKSVTKGAQVVACCALAAWLSCAGIQQRCDDMTLVLRDTATPASTQVAVECGGQVLGSLDLDLSDVLGEGFAVCGSRLALTLKGWDAAGKVVVDVSCDGLVLTTLTLDLGDMSRGATDAVDHSAGEVVQ